MHEGRMLTSKLHLHLGRLLMEQHLHLLEERCHLVEAEVVVHLEGEEAGPHRAAEVRIPIRQLAVRLTSIYDVSKY